MLLLISFAASDVAGVRLPKTSLLAPGPSLQSLSTGITAAERYLDGLHKPLGDGSAALAEYYGLPLRLRWQKSGEWVLAGEDRKAACGGLVCPNVTEIAQLRSGFGDEEARLTFRSAQDAGLVATLDVGTDWRPDAPGTVVFTITNASSAGGAADVYLYELRLGTFGEGIASPIELRVSTDDLAVLLRSFRYTVRHGSQHGYNYYRYRDRGDRADTLRRSIVDGGFGVNYDLRAPMWLQGRDLPDDFVFQVSSTTDGPELFHDCKAQSLSTSLAYPYRSKVCAVPIPSYLEIVRGDPFARAVQAIHVLDKYGDPDRDYSDGSARHTPLVIAQEQERLFSELGFGIPLCSPLGCETVDSSGVRTFQFGVLETLLGYRYGIEQSRRFADGLAALALDVQIGADDTVRTAAGDYYRPVQRGGFYLSWDSLFRFDQEKGIFYRGANQLINMPSEYLGMLATNMETTADAYAFLVLYRCAKYGSNCPVGW
jgi:hypothetical protein